MGWCHSIHNHAHFLLVITPGVCILLVPGSFTVDVGGSCCSLTGWNVSAHEIQSVFNDFDADGSGGIDFIEFLDLIQALMRKQHPTQEEVISILRAKPATRKPAELARLARFELLRMDSIARSSFNDYCCLTCTLCSTQKLAYSSCVQQVAGSFVHWEQAPVASSK
jgi:hypothetical protein